jgi:hypothetical protein
MVIGQDKQKLKDKKMKKPNKQILGQLQIEKENLLNVVKHHKKHCDGPDCNISLHWLLTIAERAGIVFTAEERSNFV